MYNIYVFSVLSKKNDESSTAIQSLEYFRPRRIMTNVDKSGVATITGLYIDDQNQLVSPVDAWEWSIVHSEIVVKQFLVEHGLIDKSSKEIDAYLDKRGIGVPDIHKIHLPVIMRNIKVKITGRFLDDCCVSLIGTGP